MKLHNFSRYVVARKNSNSQLKNGREEAYLQALRLLFPEEFLELRHMHEDLSACPLALR